ncbi:MAG: hypothetical protein Unbinned3904contig1002_21 [Prokaryotic dsDNA virus sp.]|nr:MAG: hypothetical protein Unbinned3904contig1002_21 [Prokaryotic dsDNA virus sp.]|tara:strand:+ start:8048 stop:8374 length:327 start_codon:yes stop_codon:yes gene_type:complete
MKKILITEKQVKSQSDAVLWHLKMYGHITSYEAIKEYGATRLSGIIFNHRKNGYRIDSIPIHRKTRFGKTVTLAKYVYTEPNKEMNLFKSCSIVKSTRPYTLGGYDEY